MEPNRTEPQAMTSPQVLKARCVHRNLTERSRMTPCLCWCRTQSHNCNIQSKFSSDDGLSRKATWIVTFQTTMLSPSSPYRVTTRRHSPENFDLNIYGLNLILLRPATHASTAASCNLAAQCTRVCHFAPAAWKKKVKLQIEVSSLLYTTS
jgi:hypothetical protein